MTRTAEHPTTRGTPAPSRSGPSSLSARPLGPSTHPWAWWGWAIGAAIAASFTTNPLMLLLVIGAVALVTLERRSSAPWAQSVQVYLVLAVVVIGFRVVLMSLLGGARDGLVLVELPEIPLPQWAAGIRLGGPVTLNAILAATYDGLRLAGLVICVGAANSLANPRQALKSVPAALNQLSVAIIIALSVAPQLVESLGRIRRARRLRGGPATGWKAVTAVLVPVLEDALERSMKLATAMESRGYGRAISTSRTGWGLPALLIGSLCGLVLFTYAIFALPQWGAGAWAGLIASALGAGTGLHLSGRAHRTTRYRPHPWTVGDAALVGLGLGAAAISAWLAARDYAAMNPPTTPLSWPELHPAMVLCAAVVAAALLITPPPRREDRR